MSGRGSPVRHGLVTAAAACAVAFALLALAVAGGATTDVDATAIRFADANRSEWLTALVRGVTWLGSGWVLAPLSVALGGWFLARRGDARPLSALATAVVASILLYQTVKSLLDRPRPAEALGAGGVFEGWAFPSGHATMAMAVWGLLAMISASRMTSRRWIPPVSAGAIVLAVGASRVYLGAHWPSDVLGGFLLGGFVLASVRLGSSFTQS